MAGEGSSSVPEATRGEAVDISGDSSGGEDNPCATLDPQEKRISQAERDGAGGGGDRGLTPSAEYKYWGSRDTENEKATEEKNGKANEFRVPGITPRLI